MKAMSMPRSAYCTRRFSSNASDSVYGPYSCRQEDQEEEDEEEQQQQPRCVADADGIGRARYRNSAAREGMRALSRWQKDGGGRVKGRWGSSERRQRSGKVMIDDLKD